MLESFKAVKRNRGAAGIDKVSIQMFEANLADNLRALMRDLKTGLFVPYPLRRVFIPKNETEFRPLVIPMVTSQCTSISRVSECFLVSDSAGVTRPVPKLLFVGRV